MRITETSNVLRDEVFEIDNPHVDISTVASEVKVSASPDNKCHVTIYGKPEVAQDLAEFVDISVQDHELRIRVDKRIRGLKGLLNSFSPKFNVVVQLPSSTELKISTISGDVEVDQKVKSVDINCISGDISILHNPSGACALKTISGDISTHTFSGCEYTLNSISGDIKVHIAPNLEVDVDGKSISGVLESEILLSSNTPSPSQTSETVMISASTISGDFTLARN